MYTILKKIILNGNFDREDIIKKADVFFAKNRITEDEYSELMEMLK